MSGTNLSKPPFHVSYSLENHSMFRLGLATTSGSAYPRAINIRGNHLGAIRITSESNLEKMVGECKSDDEGIIKCVVLVRSQDPTQILALFVDITDGALNTPRVAVMGQTTGFDLHLFRERIEIDSSSEKFYVHYKDCTTRYFKITAELSGTWPPEVNFRIYDA